MTIDNKNLKLLPFDIEKALAGDPVVRYDGKEGKIVFVSDKEECLFRILFVVTDEKDDDVGYFADWFRINGNNEDDDPALFMLPKTKTMWMAYDPNQELHGCLAASFSRRREAA